jgi:hypothetical protein
MLYFAWAADSHTHYFSLSKPLLGRQGDSAGSTMSLLKGWVIPYKRSFLGLLKTLEQVP